MSKILLIVCIVTLCPLITWSQQLQTARVKGRVIEKDTRQPLADATITLLHAKDSTRAGFAFAERNGTFEIKQIPAGAYQLYISYLGYKALLQPLLITPADTLLDVGALPLQKTGVNLDVVEIVELRSPMRVTKDTLEFRADSYKTRENAVMEELLKKLPAIQVDRDGIIRINGETVTRIFVDGQPFFGSDLRLATRNLPADAINKIQVIDRKSDEAQFAGIEDGKREKVINITIKQERKQQFFGKVAAGYGTNNRYAANGNLNRFGDGEQLSFLGSANNVNSPSLLDGQQPANNNGLNRAWNAGANYGKSIGKKWVLNGSYVVNEDNIENQVMTARQNILPDTTYYYNQDNQSLTHTTSHVVNTRAEFNPDTMHFLRLEGNYSYKVGSNDLRNIHRSLGDLQQLINYGELHNSLSNNAPVYRAEARFGKRFKKNGRSVSVNISTESSNNTQEGLNRSNNFFMQPNGDTLADTINQHNNRKSRQHITASYLTYMEPLLKDYYLELTYILIWRDNTLEKNTYDFNPNKHIYDRFNDSLSIFFENNSLSQYGKVGIQKQRGKSIFSLATLIYLNGLNNYASHQLIFRKHTRMIFPEAFFGYTFSNNSRLYINYTGSPDLADVSQMQPVPDNSDPLYIQLGNPDLKVGFTHNLRMSYNAFNPVTMRAFSINAYSFFYTNKVINASWFDSLGRQVSQPLNLNGAYTNTVNISNTFPLKKMQTAINTNTTLNYNRDVGYINGRKGYTYNLGINQTMGFNYSYKSLLDLGVNGSINYNGARYSLQKDNNNNFFNYAFSLTGNINLPAGFIAGVDFNYWLNTGLTAGYNQDIILLNGYVAKKLARNRALFKLQGFDLLGRNASISRNVGQSYIEDVQSKVLQRFFMCSFTYFIKEKKK